MSPDWSLLLSIASRLASQAICFLLYMTSESYSKIVIELKKKLYSFEKPR